MSPSTRLSNRSNAIPNTTNVPNDNSIKNTQNPTPAEAQAAELAKTATAKPVPVTPTKPTEALVDDPNFITVPSKKSRSKNNNNNKNKNKNKKTTTTATKNTPTIPTDPPTDDIESFTSSEISASDKTRFNILVQVLHPLNNVTPNGSMTTDRLQTILTTTLAHHLERLPLLLFQLKHIIFVKTEKRNKPHQNQYAHYFRLILAPASTQDQFDNELFYEQCLAFALQHWHLRHNHQFTISPDSSYPDQLISPEVKNPPSSDFWVKHIHLLLPAVNSNDDTAQGCLLGIPPDSWGVSRRACLDLLNILYHKLQPHFPSSKLGNTLNADFHTFLEYIGLRSSYVQTFGQKNNTKAPVFFVCCHSGDAWNLIAKAAQSAGPINIHGCSCIIHPFPKPDERPSFIQGANQLSQHIKQMVHVTTDRLLIPTIELEEDIVAQTPDLVAVVPHYVDHSPNPVCHTLIFLPTPETVSYSNDTIHLADIPPNLLAPLAPPTYLSTATTVLPKPQPDSSPDLLKQIFSQWNEPPPTNTPPDTSNTHPRKRPCTGSQDTPINLDTTDEDKDDKDDTTANPDESSDDDEEYSVEDVDDSTAHNSDMPDASNHSDSDTLHSSHDEIDDLEYPLSQTASADYARIQFYVEANHPGRITEFQTLLRHFKTTNGDPTALWTRISSWTNDNNE
jgi:hypothetical protein